MKYDIITASVASVIFPTPSTQKTTIYENAILDINRIASVLNTHNMVCKNKIDWEWGEGDVIILHSILPDELMYIINESVL